MHLLEVKKLSRSYKTGERSFYALHPCSFALPSTGLIAITGKSGSGKSTLLNLLAGIERPSKGKVLFLGKEVRRPLLGHGAGMIFQHYNLIDGESVNANIALPLAMTRRNKKRVAAAMNYFHLTELSKKDVRLLSGGEKQRVAIARAKVNNPPILFADEPTGALDETNSIIVMEALKKIAENHLVLLVSHNKALVERFADSVIQIADGHVSGSLVATPVKGKTIRKETHSSSWLPHFWMRNIRHNLAKDLMCLLAGGVGFLSALVSIGYLDHNMVAMEQEQSKSLNYLNVRISNKTSVEIPGSSLTLVKQTTPDLEEAQELIAHFGEAEIADDYSFFFPMAMAFDLEGERKEPCAFEPIWDITLKDFGLGSLSKGEAPLGEAFDECLVNEEFVAKYGVDSLGKSIDVSQRSVVQSGGKSAEVYVNVSLKIVGVVKEFGFLNSPRVYCSYPRMAEALGAIEVSFGAAETETLQELILDAPLDSPIRGYDRMVFFKDRAGVESLFKTLQEGGIEGYEISSEAFALHQSFASLSMAFTSSLSLFVAIALLGLGLILGMASYSSFVAGRKESAILTVLGARSSEIVSIYVFEASSLCVLSASIALALGPFLQQFLNVFLQKRFDIPNLIAIPYGSYLGVPGLLFILILGGALLVGLLSSLLPILVNRRIPLVEELRDE